MNGDERVDAWQGADGEREFAERVRTLLADDALTLQPSMAPYPAIRRRGVAERRRRVAAAGAALVTLAVAPVGAYALGGADRGGEGASPAVSATASRSPVPTASATSPGPSGPATDGQLLDGVTRRSAVSMLEDCLDSDLGREPHRGPGVAEEYRILLAMRSTGDSNSPGDGHFVVAARDDAARTRVICTVKEGEVAGLNIGGVAEGPPDQGPVVPDVNALRLYAQSAMDRGNWKLPFRWGSIGLVDPSVARVTVSYGDGETRPAVLDHGWFVATGELDQQVTRAPRIKGYDAAGELVYDSDRDEHYMAELP
ncbi:hypothetical protein AB0K92_11665 [Streptomyces sp. NPDC052687]|uniref:hypothetical protein n=1 Tax=Streptomyces sp. NPDC052687 TaxID=3154759 RepID=UPI00341EC8BF